MERTLLKKLKWLPESIEEQNRIYDPAKKALDELEYVILKSDNLIRQNEMVHFYKLEPDFHIPKHGHDFIEVFYTCKGVVQHVVQGNIVNVREGELLFMSQNTVHEIDPVSEEDVGVYFAFVPEFFHQINSMMETGNTVAEFIFNSLFGRDKRTSYFHFQTASNRRIHNLIENMIEIILSGKQSSMKLLQNTMLLIFLEMIVSFEESYKNEMKQINGGNIMEVISYIDKNYKKASLSELSKEMNISAAYLSQMIKKNTGVTFKKLLQDRRFQVAAELISFSDLTIHSIAEKVGYENISYFYKKFAERYEMTPNAYRRYHQNRDMKDEEERMLLQNKLDQYWTERSDSYSKQNQKQLENEHREKWKKLILAHVPENKNLKVLDIGTGPGFLAILLTECGYDVVAVDRNSRMLLKAEENARKYGVTVEFRKIGDELPFSDNSFDLVISRDVTWMLLQPEKIMENWYKKVKPEGRLVYFDANWYGYLNDTEERKTYKQFRKFVKERNGFIYPKARELEAMALKLPLTSEERPRWDIAYWRKKRVKKVSTITKLNADIYSDIEQLQYLKTPEFLVVVEK